MGTDRVILLDTVHLHGVLPRQLHRSSEHLVHRAAAPDHEVCVPHSACCREAWWKKRRLLQHVTMDFRKLGESSSDLQLSDCLPRLWDEDAGCRFVGQGRGAQGAVLSNLVLAMG